MLNDWCAKNKPSASWYVAKQMNGKMAPIGLPCCAHGMAIAIKMYCTVPESMASPMPAKAPIKPALVL